MLSRMVLINFVAFVVFKILLNLFSMQNHLDANNCWHKQSLQNFPSWHHIYFQCTFRISFWSCVIFGSLQWLKGYPGLTLVFVWNSAQGEKFTLTFQEFSSSIDKNFILAGDWALGYHSIKFRQFPHIP